MKFYQVHTSYDHGVCAGFEYFTSRETANREMREFLRNNPTEEAEIVAIEIEPTKHGILNALNRYASHPDNG